MAKEKEDPAEAVAQHGEAELEDAAHAHGEPGTEREPTDEDIEKIRQNFAGAGRITASVLREVPKLVLPGESFLDIAESLEKMIIDAGGALRFPPTFRSTTSQRISPLRRKTRCWSAKPTL